MESRGFPRDTAREMSEEDVEVVRRVFEHWERGDFAGGRDLFEDRCEVVFGTSAFPDAGAYSVGREALGAWINFTEAFEEFATGMDEVIDAGERVVALAWIRGRGRVSGAAVDKEVGALFIIRHGKIARFDLVDRPEALEAAGLSE